jgi:hypothetical protein
MSDEIDGIAARALADLDYHWGSTYLITRDPAGTWLALPRMLPAGPPLTAATPGELRVLIRADYDRRTLPPPADTGSL